MSEIKPVDLPDAKKSLKIGPTRRSRLEYQNQRACLSTSLPLSFKGATPPRPDPGHPPSLVGAVVKRFGFKPPPLTRAVKRGLRRFTRLWLKRNLTPLTDADIPTFDEWLESTPYSATRKEELRVEWDKFCANPDFESFSRVKSFVKDETYETYKYPRAINSRVDSAKCYFGPIVQAVSDKLFALPWFIKKVPVPDRPMVIRDELYCPASGEDYSFTDYTSFEAHFTKEVMNISQVELFKFMLSGGSHNLWLNVYAATMTGTNKIEFKDLSVKIDAVRMSGEMDTSLSNGFTNLMCFLYAVQQRGGTCKGFVEGDDGLFRVTPSSSTPTEKDFADMAFTIKIGSTKDLSEASFCGQVYDMNDLIVVTDPREVLCRMGWTNKKYVQARPATLMQLLRAKGYSLVYQYNGCPILSKLGRRILFLTQDTTISQRIYDNMDQWERSKVCLQLPPEREPGEATRALVAKLYDVTVEEQLKIELWIDQLELGMHQQPFPKVPTDWTDYYERYSTNYLSKDPCWLLRDETDYLKLLDSKSCCRGFVSSLGVGG